MNLPRRSFLQAITATLTGLWAGKVAEGVEVKEAPPEPAKAIEGTGGTVTLAGVPWTVTLTDGDTTSRFDTRGFQYVRAARLDGKPILQGSHNRVTWVNL